MWPFGSSKLKAHLDYLNAKLSSMQIDFQILKECINDKDKLIGELASKAEEFKKEERKAIQLYEMQCSLVDKLNNDNRELKEQTLVLSDEVVGLKGRLEESESHLSEYTEKSELADREITRLKEQNELLIKVAETNREQIDISMKHIEQLGDEILSLQGGRESRDKHIEELEEQIHTLESQIATLKESNAVLASEVSRTGTL